ncbi:phage holin family protein [Leminorella grimontii]|uniref:phage holin family protein n=1 Tax=Leminorella grimontii TaxID=82981 RepID=UPI0032205D6C
MRMPWKNDTALLAAVMAVLGAIASYSNQILQGEKFRWSTLFLKAIVAVFCGAMVVLAGSYYQWNPEFSGGVAGLSGWFGVEFIKVLEKLFINKAPGGRA